jgi:hypothetical protein
MLQIPVIEWNLVVNPKVDDSSLFRDMPYEKRMKIIAALIRMHVRHAKG